MLCPHKIFHSSVTTNANHYTLWLMQSSTPSSNLHYDKLHVKQHQQISYTSLHDNLPRYQITGNYSVVKRSERWRLKIIWVWNTFSVQGLSHEPRHSWFGSHSGPLVNVISHLSTAGAQNAVTSNESNIESEHSFYDNMQDLTQLDYVITYMIIYSS